MSIFFTSNEHKKRFLAVIQSSGESGVYNGKIDAYYGPALYILTCDLHIWENVRPFVRPHGILFKDMVKQTRVLSSGEKFLIACASSLFSSSGSVSLHDVYLLSDANYRVFLTAIDMHVHLPLLADIVLAENENEQETL